MDTSGGGDLRGLLSSRERYTALEEEISEKGDSCIAVTLLKLGRNLTVGKLNIAGHRDGRKTLLNPT